METFFHPSKSAAYSRELEQKWAAEKKVLRQECLVELKHKLLEVTQAQHLTLDEDRKTLQDAFEDGTLLDLKQKLDAIALSGKQLSQVFMNSLVTTFVHRIAAAAIHSRKKAQQDLANEKATAHDPDNHANFHQTPGHNLAKPIALAPITSPQVSSSFQGTSSRCPPLSQMGAAVEDECSQARVGGSTGLDLEGFLVDRVLKRPPQDETGSYSLQALLTGLVQQRVDLDHQVYEERNLFAKRSAYLRDCCTAAEDEKKMAQTELAAAMASLVLAQKERAVAASCRAAALDELKHATPLHEKIHPGSISDASRGPHDLKPAATIIGHNTPMLWAQVPQLQLGTSPRPPLPRSTCPEIPNLTPLDSPDDKMSLCHSKEPCSTAAATYDDKPTWPKVVTEVLEHDERRESSIITQSSVKDEVLFIKSGPGVLENPIGPYIRPPMPLEDMLKCIRCLFGKDKSLKTGNRARAFLGLPWSEIVSFDPDVLLRRGVLGIKEGSTGMASRLRMMTIIESALSNQNDDTIPADVWERPTHFCENCQKRYPISVNSNEAVITFEDSVQREGDVFPSQVSVEGNSAAQETTGTKNSKAKRNRKKLRKTRITTHTPN